MSAGAKDTMGRGGGYKHDQREDGRVERSLGESRSTVESAKYNLHKKEKGKEESPRPLLQQQQP